MPKLDTLVAIANHQRDAESGLRLVFAHSNPNYNSRFFGYRASEVTEELAGRLWESEMRAALVTLARTEAALRQDYLRRAKGKFSDDISIEFRKIFKKHGARAALENHILDVWSKKVTSQEKRVIGTLKGMFKFRHWLAHGRYWNQSAKHSFQDVYEVAALTFQIIDAN